MFAALEQRELALDTRLNVTLTPAMTLELFAQPFIETGIYSGYQEFIAPRQSSRRAFADVTSTGDGEGRLDLIRTGADSVIAIEHPDNVFQLKVNYWLSR